jgi:hypothetical protein
MQPSRKSVAHYFSNTDDDIPWAILRGQEMGHAPNGKRADNEPIKSHSSARTAAQQLNPFHSAARLIFLQPSRFFRINSAGNAGVAISPSGRYTCSATPSATDVSVT